MPRLYEVRIAGVQPLTTVEWEDRLSAVIFLQGCPWRCRYCHNWELLDLPDEALTRWADVEALLLDRRGFLDAVVFSGGEPTFQPSLPEAIARARDLGYQTALHTNGYSPERLRELLAEGLLDYIAMDIKAPPDKYPAITGIDASGEPIFTSAELITRSGVDHEFRTTYHPALLDPEDILAIATRLTSLGARAYFVQQFRAEGCRDHPLNNSPTLPALLPDQFVARLSEMFPRFAFRTH